MLLDSYIPVNVITKAGQRQSRLASGRVLVLPVAAGSAATGRMDAQEVAAASEAGMDARRE